MEVIQCTLENLPLLAQMNIGFGFDVLIKKDKGKL
jgi:hypothetical protein